MTMISEQITGTWNYLFHDLCDERTRDWWPGPGVLLLILASYLYFCKRAGPAWMKHRKPFDLTAVIFYYNVFQIIISTYLFVAGAHAFTEFNLTCQPVRYGASPETRTVHNLVWSYATLKLVELLDTIFFVLRKKDRQISSLHVYHHFMMPIAGFISLKYFPDGHGLSLGIINCLVHMIMYTYYLIAGLGPRYQKILWWKRYVTILQLVQFLLVFVHNAVPLFISCEYPRWINVTLCCCSLHFVYMFGNFYYVNYVQPSTKTEKTRKIE